MHLKYEPSSEPLHTNPYIREPTPQSRLISAEGLVGQGEEGKMVAILNAFDGAYRSKEAIIILDGVERLLGWSRIGPRFSNDLLQVLQRPPLSLSRTHTNTHTHTHSLSFTHTYTDSLSLSFSLSTALVAWVQILSVLVGKEPPQGRRLLLIATSSNEDALSGTPIYDSE